MKQDLREVLTMFLVIGVGILLGTVAIRYLPDLGHLFP